MEKQSLKLVEIRDFVQEDKQNRCFVGMLIDQNEPNGILAISGNRSMIIGQIAYAMKDSEDFRAIITDASKMFLIDFISKKELKL